MPRLSIRSLGEGGQRRLAVPKEGNSHADQERSRRPLGLHQVLSWRRILLPRRRCGYGHSRVNDSRVHLSLVIPLGPHLWSSFRRQRRERGHTGESLTATEVEFALQELADPFCGFVHCSALRNALVGSPTFSCIPFVSLSGSMAHRKRSVQQ